jgi:AcrR family transcriptional regulator
MEVDERPLRADARRNRNAILVAARAVFAEHGLDAPLELIASEAHVGRATQHRHFPTRDGLIRAIFDDNLEALEQIARDAADPADAYVALLLAVVEQMEASRGFIELFNTRVVSVEIQQEIGERFLAIVSEPLRAAQRAGRVRADLRPEDTFLVTDMLAAATRPRPGLPAAAHARGVQLVLESIQADPRLPLDGAP